MNKWMDKLKMNEWVKRVLVIIILLDGSTNIAGLQRKRNLLKFNVNKNNRS